MQSVRPVQGTSTEFSIFGASEFTLQRQLVAFSSTLGFQPPDTIDKLVQVERIDPRAVISGAAVDRFVDSKTVRGSPGRPLASAGATI